MWFLVSFVLYVRAAEPPAMTTSQSDGFWRTELLVPAPLSVVRAQLEDPIAAARFSPDITSLTYVTRAECPTLRAQLAGITSIAYDYRRCATADGWHETLVSSNGLEAYEVRWNLEDAGGSTRVRYAVKVDTVLPAPAFIMSRQMKSSMTTIVGRLYRAVTGKSLSSDE